MLSLGSSWLQLTAYVSGLLGQPSPHTQCQAFGQQRKAPVGLPGWKIFLSKRPPVAEKALSPKEPFTTAMHYIWETSAEFLPLICSTSMYCVRVPSLLI